MNERVNFLLVGVGGQGTILASDVLADVGMAAGFQPKQAEVHGMSQRGGSVTSHVRWGPVVNSPLIGAGEVDVLLAFERWEALRSVNQLRRGALAVINAQSIVPMGVAAGHAGFPDEERLRSVMEQVGGPVRFLDGAAIAERLGYPRVANVVLLGALSLLLAQSRPDMQRITSEIWLNVIGERVPQRHVAFNHAAFIAGREAVIAQSVSADGPTARG